MRPTSESLELVDQLIESCLVKRTIGIAQEDLKVVVIVDGDLYVTDAKDGLTQPAYPREVFGFKYPLHGGV